MTTDVLAAPGLVTWAGRENELHGKQSFITHHELHRSPLFDDASLIQAIDSYPRNRVQVFTMGKDPVDRSEWTPVDTSGASGAEIWQALQKGRLWVKLQRLDLHWPEVGALMKNAYDGMGRSGISPIEWTRPLLLISSPNAIVYYHADPNPTMLWQIRGVKRAWIYPPNEPKLLDPALLEQIFAGEIDEEAPYVPDFDKAASVYDLKPGEVLCWPINAPHRIVNHDSLNISVSVPYGNASGDVRAQLYLGNLMLRRMLHLGRLSTREQGAAATFKRTLFRAMRKFKLDKRYTRPRRPYLTNVRIDASAPSGLVKIPGSPVKTPF
jgi:hypothetical protein